jgi:hypothetical protein
MIPHKTSNSQVKKTKKNIVENQGSIWLDPSLKTQNTREGRGGDL